MTPEPLHTSHPHWPFVVDGEPPDEPSDLEPGELPGADESTTEARVTINEAHGGPDAAKCAECGRSIHVIKCEMCACGKFSNQTGEP